MGDDGGLGPLVGFMNLVGGGLNLAGKGLQQLPKVPRMAGEAYSRLPPSAQKAINLSLEYGMPLGDFVNQMRQGRDPAEAATCLLYTSPSPRDVEESRMPSSA